jgi:hypothetical protein
MALHALHAWITSPGNHASTDDISTPCREDFKSPAEMLAAIALVFGWVEQDWSTQKNKDGHWKSDFAWACGDSLESARDIPEHAAPTGQEISALSSQQDESCQNDSSTEIADESPKWQTIWNKACALLSVRLNWKSSGAKPWEKLPNFAGSIAFLSASPNTDPGLELDVLTPHHKDYYESPELNVVAADTEDPVPVFFPAIKAQKDGDYFIFPVVPLHHSDNASLKLARTWLARGLEFFGLGAKTSAGYGWFDASPELNIRIETLQRSHALVNELKVHHTGFQEWPEDKKEEAILLLADRRGECRQWADIDPESFEPVRDYAEANKIPLL